MVGYKCGICTKIMGLGQLRMIGRCTFNRETISSSSCSAEVQAHDAPVLRMSWAHPELGSIIVLSSFDRTVKVWEQVPPLGQPDSSQQLNGSGSSSQLQPSNSRWVERAVLTDARGTVGAVEFAPYHFGLKFATIASDNQLRIYECLEQPSLTTWQLSEELDVQSLPSFAPPSAHSRSHTVALATPTQTNATLDVPSASLITQALQQGIQQNISGAPQAPTRSGTGNRKANGGWCISWCKDRYWGELIAVGCRVNGIVKLSPSRCPTAVLTLDPAPTPEAAQASSAPEAQATDADHAMAAPLAFAITRVRIWRVKLGNGLDREEEEEEGKWMASVVAHR
ncbi:hypothetical protein D9615_006200 [Tricholomella constricta]|uniref:Uncharacterized protein n=1 Tax=Tricholomella constricta TaxID=117010 RepID=A0A8H5HAR6_9AGAR|nr:hypothetical protein D9615_006200 [Tricholomella constricta]